MRQALLFALPFLCLAQSASAAPIRDMSLPPGESLRQHNVKSSPTTQWPGGDSYNSSGNQGAPIGLRNLQGQQPITQASRFMDGYCDPNFQAAAERRGNVAQTCFDNARRNACELFMRLPTDAQDAVERIVNCASAEGEPAMAELCRNPERLQVEMVKKYWNQQETVRGILFVPEMVINPLAYCNRTGG